jgi:hypothetical protein
MTYTWLITTPGGYGNHAIAIEDEAGDITMLGDWCFVAPPIRRKKKQLLLVLFLASKKNLKKKDSFYICPQDSEWIGASAGDLVGYTKNSEYEMELLDGSKAYRMRTTELVYVKEA